MIESVYFDAAANTFSVTAPVGCLVITESLLLRQTDSFEPYKRLEAPRELFDRLRANGSQPFGGAESMKLCRCSSLSASRASDRCRLRQSICAKRKSR
jgi:hypothetical protein